MCASARNPTTTRTMVFKFIDCVFGIEDVAFVDNIVSPYALLSRDGAVPSEWKQTYGRNTQGGFAHPSYDLENTAADGIGWGIVYEDKVGKQQPVWAVYAPPAGYRLWGKEWMSKRQLCVGFTSNHT